VKGRKLKPSVLHQLHGRPGKRRLNPDEPKPPGTLDDPPDWMGPSQRAGWAYAVAAMPRGVLTQADRGVLGVWVVAEDLHRRATEAQNQAGALLVRAPHTGTPQQSPYLPIINRQALLMLRAAAELGFSPVSRPRINAGTVALAPVGIAPEDAGASEPELSLEDFLANHPGRRITH
jgi:phage terminase small subunit